jgi:FKBP-type peptidyl-prolyl cis-trans isomerase SlpA
MGNGELAPNLEQCLLGLAIGERKVFVLEPSRAYGAHDAKLVQRLPLANLPETEAIEPLTLLEFTAANSARYSGFVREIDSEAALVDFNHPLAGKSIRFEVEIIGIL